MGKNNIGLDYKYLRLRDAFYSLGREYCTDGIHPSELSIVLYHLFPKIDLGETPLEYLRATMSYYSKWNATRKRSPLMFVQVSRALWTLTDEQWHRAPKTPEPEPHEIEATPALEGSPILVTHRRRERSKLAQQFKANLDDLRCEVCRFDFEKKYGALGRGYIEAHHDIPLAQGPRLTRIEDFRALCSNCHRMIHRNAQITVSDLKEIMASTRRSRKST